jgi:hypothetical protein
VSESVEQAAPFRAVVQHRGADDRLAAETDWKARAEREAAAIIAEAMPNTAMQGYETTVALIAIGWLQGASFGCHSALGHVDAAFARLRESL